METLNGSGYGYGDGSGDGYGYGDGSGDGYGSGDGNGYGYVYGDGYGYGYGYVYGDEWVDVKREIISISRFNYLLEWLDPNHIRDATKMVHVDYDSLKTNPIINNEN